MKLSAPIYRLKSQAKALKQQQNIVLSEALNIVARQQGYASWSLLVSKHKNPLPNHYHEVLDYLNPGDLVLLAARPAVGKVRFAAGLIAQTHKQLRPTSYLFTMVEREQVLQKRISAYFSEPGDSAAYCRIDSSDDICAEYIQSVVGENFNPGLLVVVDYLQMLDEKRINPPLQQQILTLQQFAKDSGCIIVFICQIDRNIEARQDQRPSLDDIRLPNPLDLGLFNKIIFLYRQTEQLRVGFASNDKHSFKLNLMDSLG